MEGGIAANHELYNVVNLNVSYACINYQWRRSGNHTRQAFLITCSSSREMLRSRHALVDTSTVALQLVGAHRNPGTFVATPSGCCHIHSTLIVVCLI
jgi:hypothetical protein